jgi:hypothetical protein
MLKLPVTRCEANDKLAYYQTSVQVKDIVPYILGGQDPRSSNWSRLAPVVQNLYLKLQRKTTKPRREEVERYITNRMAPNALWIGAFPPIVIGVPTPQEYKPHEDQDNYESLGLLRLSNDLNYPNVVIDGLGRLSGLIEISLDKEADPAIREWASKFRVPILLITGNNGHTLTTEELGQLFFDFNVLGTPVSKGHAIDLDISDPYIIVAGKVGELRVVHRYGGMDDRATSIGKGMWTTKSILLKSVRSAAEGPGAWVDHVRDSIPNAWMDSEAKKTEVIDRFDIVLTALTEQFEADKVLPDYTLLRTPVWWTAIGLIIHDLFRSYGGDTFSEDMRERLLRRLAKIDWSLGNPDFGFLGAPVADRDRKTGEMKPIPTDEQGRPVITRFHGGSKAYFNLAAFLRRKIGLYSAVQYGDDYGVSVYFDAEGQPIETRSHAHPAETEAV